MNTYELIIGLMAIIMATVNFGLWQKSFQAGMFLFFTLMSLAFLMERYIR